MTDFDCDDKPQSTGTTLMTADQLKREREVFDAARSLAMAQERARAEKTWWRFSLLMPFGVTIVVSCVIGVVFFYSFQLMADAWAATHWMWH